MQMINKVTPEVYKTLVAIIDERASYTQRRFP